VKKAPVKLQSLLFESLFGRRITLDADGNYFPALISLNVKPDEELAKWAIDHGFTEMYVT
jgi:hypothetical protein